GQNAVSCDARGASRWCARRPPPPWSLGGGVGAAGDFVKPPWISRVFARRRRRLGRSPGGAVGARRGAVPPEGSRPRRTIGSIGRAFPAVYAVRSWSRRAR